MLSAARFAIAQSDQNNYDAGKTPAQLFTSDCGICHKSPAGLVKDPGLFGLGLDSFLRDHYTASPQAAAAIAGYLKSVNAAQEPSQKGSKRRKSDSQAKGSDKAGDKPEGKASRKTKGGAESKTNTKSGDKPEAKTPEAKTSEPKASEPKSPDAQASDSKPPDAAAKPADKPN